MPAEKTGGRKKGTPNKVTGAVRDMILAALSAVGGQKYLEKQAAANPVAFMSLLAKVMPTQISADVQHNYVARIPSLSNDMDEWERQHASKLNPPQTLQ
jgi:hypothetical protein